ncbi:MAG TPA: reverse transcriptase domain-containing protein [Vicingaceae bacterium]
MELEKWFKPKKYPHIGSPITIKDYNWVKAYVENFDKVRIHSFLPLIHKSIVKRKFRADNSILKTNPSGKRKRKIGKPKVRDIFFASHLDSLILSKYNEELADAYEKHIEDKNFNESIVAYRKIPILKESKKNKCNIDFAKTTFEFIQNNRKKKLTAIVADVTSFFDNLNHRTLKKQWSRVLKKTTLPKDHYNLFKALTNIKYIEGEQLFKNYDNTMYVKKGIPNSSTKTEHIRKKIKSNRFFKEKNATHYCKKKEFLKNNLNLIISKNNSVGIPQGSPISATLANIYMLDFDQEIFDKVSSIDGFYQRYSDDLIIICEQKYEDEIIKLIREKIDTLVNLKIEPDKTKIFRFEDLEAKFTGFEIDEKTKKPNFNKTLEYLGFSYDGQRVLIKNSGFSKFYRSMKNSFKKSTSLALHSKNPDKSLFKSKLYKRFTHRGAKRKLIYRPSKTDKTVYEKSNEYYWGNYLSYINKANDSMKSINGGDFVKRQSRKFWKKFHDLMKFHEARLK